MGVIKSYNFGGICQCIWKGCSHPIRDWIIANRVEIGLAAVFALLFAVIVDLLRLGSGIRSGVRRVINKWSERSVARLRKRIEGLEWYRNSLSSDKVLYLITLRYVLWLLTLIAAGAFVMASAAVSGRAIVNVEGGMLAAIAFGGAIIAGIRGARYASLDTHEKVLRMIESLDKDIARLKEKLGLREAA